MGETSQWAEWLRALDVVRATITRGFASLERWERTHQAADLPRAVQDFQRVIELAPGRPEGYYGLAEVQRRQEQSAEALGNVGEALLRAPHHTMSLHLRAWLFCDRGQWAEATQDFTRVLEQEPHHAIALYGRGTCAGNRGQWDHALHDLDRALALVPDFGPALQMRAWGKGQRGEWADAVDDYTAAINHATDQGLETGDLLTWRAWACFQAGQDDAALADYPQAVARKPQDVAVYLDWAYVLSMTGDWEESETIASKAIALDSTSSSAYEGRALARCYVGDLSGAIQDATQAIELDPEQSHYYDIRAWAYVRQGNWQAAINDCNQTIALDSKHDYVYNHLARAYLELQQPNKALEALRKVLEVNQQQFTLPASRRERAMRVGWRAVVDDWTVALQRWPNHPVALLGQAIAQSLAGDGKRTYESLQEEAQRCQDQVC